MGNAALVDPEALILGGGLIENNSLLVSALAEELAQLVRPWANQALRVMPSRLGYYGGVLCTAALVFDRMHDSKPVSYLRPAAVYMLDGGLPPRSTR